MTDVIVGFAGKKGAGKDTAADALTHIAENAGWTVHRYAFGDELKAMLLDLNPLIESDGWVDVRLLDLVKAYGWDIAKREYPEVRELLQRLATEGVRKRDPHFWVKVLDGKLYANMGNEGCNLHLVTDVRFENEASLIYTYYSGPVVKIINPNDSGDDSHASENQHIRAQYTIVNDHTRGFEDLSNRMESLWLDIVDEDSDWRYWNE